MSKKRRSAEKWDMPLPTEPPKFAFEGVRWTLHCKKGGHTEYMYADAIVSRGGILVPFSPQTQCFLFDCSYSSGRLIWEAAKQREKEGTLLMIPNYVFWIFAAPDAEKAFASLNWGEKRGMATYCLEHPGALGPEGSTIPERWLAENGPSYLAFNRPDEERLYVDWIVKPFNRAALERVVGEYVVIPTLCRIWAAHTAQEDGNPCARFREVAVQDHVRMLSELFRQKEYRAMLALFAALKAWEEERTGTGYTDGAYTRTLFAQYTEKIMQTGDTGIASAWLACGNELFPGGLSEAAETEFELGPSERPNIYLQYGASFVFGRYPQTAEGGVLPIEWIVLDQRDGKLLLLSRNTLALKKFHETEEPVSWVTCTLRTWLNSEFLQEAFSAEERERIEPQTYFTNQDRTESVQDMVFVLNHSEFGKYFPFEPESAALPSAYMTVVGKEAGIWSAAAWWLRTAGKTDTKMMYVPSDGYPDKYGYAVNRLICCVRPAVWIRLAE